VPARLSFQQAGISACDRLRLAGQITRGSNSLAEQDPFGLRRRAKSEGKREIRKMRRRSLSVIALIATCMFIGSCAGLNESGQNVKYVTKSEASKECKEVGEVSIGSIFPLLDMTSVKNSMRNKTAEMGGNFLVIDDIKSVHGTNGSANGYAGSGRAYQCP
jgi:hypothetical protein